MVDANRPLSNNTENKLRRILEERIREAQPRFNVTYDGAKQQPQLEVRAGRKRRSFNLPPNQVQTGDVEF